MRGRGRLRNETQAGVCRDGQGADAAAAAAMGATAAAAATTKKGATARGTLVALHRGRPTAADLGEQRRRRVKGARISKCREAPFTSTTTPTPWPRGLIALVGIAKWPAWTGPEWRTAHRASAARRPPCPTSTHLVEMYLSGYTVHRSLTMLRCLAWTRAPWDLPDSSFPCAYTAPPLFASRPRPVHRNPPRAHPPWKLRACRLAGQWAATVETGARASSLLWRFAFMHTAAILQKTYLVNTNMLHSTVYTHTPAVGIVTSSCT